MLTMINIAQEYVSPQELLDAKNQKTEAKRQKLERKQAKKLLKLNKEGDRV